MTMTLAVFLLLTSTSAVKLSMRNNIQAKTTSTTQQYEDGEYLGCFVDSWNRDLSRKVDGSYTP